MTTDVNENQDKKIEEAKKLISTIYSRSLKMLQLEFESFQVEGRIMNHPGFGPLFAYQLKDNDSDKQYACGFLMNEMLEKHKDAARAQQWLASFFIDMIDEQVSKPLPTPPQSQEESKKLFDQQIMPHCASSVREEFNTEKLYINISVHEKVGPVLEAGFPSIKDGNNVCAMPIQYLLTLYLLNRDPAEPLVNGLYLIREQHGLD
ncbi:MULTISPECIES: hypothetical protein [Paenibacillus]|uniref:hypothetical protein n=1 Tax=Paenibacillus TaxID=44249 RepID=UPI00203F47B1|nr:hypothetical protein [Paenibacillus camelliae]MCM3631935.1 hypothetical protein [Paenibacillus camelliae]